jgi:methionine-rich copper-binding protein CopC
MIITTKNLANNILNLIKSNISWAQIITDQATRNVSVMSMNIIDNSSNNELVLSIELYRSEEVAENLQQILFYDVSNNLIFKTINLSSQLPAAKISFVYQIKLVYSQ